MKKDTQNEKVDADKISMEKVYEEMFTKPNNKSKLYNHWQVSKPNDMHQADLIFTTTDRGYKYILSVIDMASRYKAGRPLKTKDTKTVNNALMSIYKNDKHLKIPNTLNTDAGSEFDSKVFKDWAKQNSVTLKYNKPSYHLAFVEAMNRDLIRRLYKTQTISELKTGKEKRNWVNRLQKEINFMNNRTTRLIGMKPIDAVKQETVEQPQNKHSKTDAGNYHEKGTIVRRLLNSDEVLNLSDLKISVGRRRITDPIWSFQLYEVVDADRHCEHCLYYHTIKAVNGDQYPHKQTYYELLESSIRV